MPGAQVIAMPQSVVAQPGKALGRPGGVSVDELKKFKQLFAKADKDGNNTLDPNELTTILRQMGMPTTPQAMQQFMSKYDSDGDGKISFQEFMAAFHTAPAALPPQPQLNTVGADGKFVDQAFPPNNDSVFRTPNPAADHAQDVMNATQGGKIQWKRCSEICKGGKLFNNVHPNDISQGVLGDCWLLAGLAGLAEFEGAVFHMFEQKTVSPDGKYTLRIFNHPARRWESVTIDDYIPVSAVDGKPIMAKPQDNEMWVLLAEKAFAKWFGSYVQTQGAFVLVPFMLLTDSGPCKGFSQVKRGPNFDVNNYTISRVTLEDARNRNSCKIVPAGQTTADQVWNEICAADRQNHIMAAFTMKDPPSGGGRGASGEVIGSDGIAKGHAYSVITAKEVVADGRTWRVLRVRNPWGSNPTSEWKGPLGDSWSEWGRFPELRRKLGIDKSETDGMFWMNWDDFRARFSDLGVVPKSMEVPKVGQVEGDVAGTQPDAKHGKKFNKDQPEAPAPSPVMPAAPVIIGGPRYMAGSAVVAPPRLGMSMSMPTLAAPMTYASPPVTYASPPVTYASPPVTYASPLAQYGSPVRFM